MNFGANMKTAFFTIVMVLMMSLPAMAQDGRGRCLDSTVMFYNCMKGGTELERNLATTYLLGSIQTMASLDLIVVPRDKNMAHFKFEYIDFVEANGSIHNERPARGVSMYLLNTYGNKENAQGMSYARSIGLVK